MRYSVPFGTPEVPPIPPGAPGPASSSVVSPFPRYINGNPVTGTAGSIPPNTSFDEAQIEIINVIINAGLTPDHNNLTQLWLALEALFAQRYITTPIVKTVHGSGADFPDLHAAMMWVQDYIITQTGSVTFMIAPGKWVYTTTLEIWHPNANRIFIQGSALLGGAPSYANITCTGYSAAARAADATNQLIYLRSVFASELQFTGGVTGIRNFSFGPTLRYLLISGSQDIGPNPYDGRAIETYDDMWYDCLAIWGFGESGVRIWNCTFRSVTSLSITICACGVYGVHSFGGGWIGQTGQEAIFASNGQIGFRGFGSWNWFDRVTAKGTGGTGNGFDLLQGGFINAVTWLDSHQNAGCGIQLIGQVTTFINVAYLQNNGSYGLVTSGGQAYVPNSAWGGNGSGYDILAQEGAIVNAIGAGGLGLTSPPVNTAGNAMAYIEH